MTSSLLLLWDSQLCDYRTGTTRYQKYTHLATVYELFMLSIETIITIVPWSKGKLIVWDATCPDTFAASHRRHATHGAGCVAGHTEGKKSEKYPHLAPTYQFKPVAIETSGAIRPSLRVFIRELGRRVALEIGEARSTSYLIQWLSVAIQRGNAAAVLGCTSHPNWIN